MCLQVNWDKEIGYHPSKFLEHETTKWKSFWAPYDLAYLDEQLAGELNAVRNFALEDSVDKTFTDLELDLALERYKKDTLGVDLWPASSLRALPKQAKQAT